MARQVERLSAQGVARASKPGSYPDGNGLYLRVGPSGSKSWVLRYRHAGKRRDMGLGAYPLFSLADARARANEQRRKLADKADPILERRAQAAAEAVERMKAITFSEAAEKYIEAHSDGWRGGGKSEAQWRSSLSAYAYPVIGSLPVAAIDTGLVMKVIEGPWKTRTETASRVRGRIEAILGWAAVRGYRPAGDNPARWRGHLEHMLPARGKVAPVRGHVAMPYAELPEFMARLRQETSIAARALEFTILTAARAGEATGATWEEIDLANRLWTIPASRMKAGREHRVPLSDRAVAIVEEMAQVRQNAHVFPGAHGRMHRTTLFDLLRRNMGRDDLTTHGFRSTFSTWAAEQRGGVPFEIREACLAHLVGSATERSYNRALFADARRRLLQDWSAFCASPVPAMAEVVVPIRA